MKADHTIPNLTSKMLNAELSGNPSTKDVVDLKNGASNQTGKQPSTVPGSDVDELCRVMAILLPSGTKETILQKTKLYLKRHPALLSNMRRGELLDFDGANELEIQISAAPTAIFLSLSLALVALESLSFFQASYCTPPFLLIIPAPCVRPIDKTVSGKSKRNGG
jgi:hypothetical protein